MRAKGALSVSETMFLKTGIVCHRNLKRCLPKPIGLTENQAFLNRTGILGVRYLEFRA